MRSVASALSSSCVRFVLRSRDPQWCTTPGRSERRGQWLSIGHTLLLLLIALQAQAFEAFPLKETHAPEKSFGSPCALATSTNGTAANYRWYNVCSGYLWTFSAWSAGEGVGVRFGGASQPAVNSSNDVKRVITYFRNVVPNYNQTVDIYLDQDTNNDGCPDANLASDLNLDPALRWNCSEFNVPIQQSVTSVVVRQVHDGGAAPTFATDGLRNTTCDPNAPQRSYYYGISGSVCLPWTGADGTFDNFLTWLVIDGGALPLTEACCYTDGSCAILLPSECTATGGAPQGPGTSCASTNCPLPVEACCFLDCSCAEMPATDCAAAGGTPKGQGTSCSPTICDAPADTAAGGPPHVVAIVLGRRTAAEGFPAKAENEGFEALGERVKKVFEEKGWTAIPVGWPEGPTDSRGAAESEVDAVLANTQYQAVVVIAHGVAGAPSPRFIVDRGGDPGGPVEYDLEKVKCKNKVVREYIAVFACEYAKSETEANLRAAWQVKQGGTFKSSKETISFNKKTAENFKVEPPRDVRQLPAADAAVHPMISESQEALGTECTYGTCTLIVGPNGESADEFFDFRGGLDSAFIAPDTIETIGPLPCGGASVDFFFGDPPETSAVAVAVYGANPTGAILPKYALPLDGYLCVLPEPRSYTTNADSIFVRWPYDEAQVTALGGHEANVRLYYLGAGDTLADVTGSVDRDANVVVSRSAEGGFFVQVVAISTPVPTAFELSDDAVLSALPNPFTTHVILRMPAIDGVITIFDATGRVVRRLDTGQGDGGDTFWNGADAANVAVPAGVYFARWTDGRRASTARLMCVR